MEIDPLHWAGVDYLWNPHKRLFAGYLLSSLLIAWLYLKWHGKPLISLFNRQIWLHPSARLDYVYFIFASLIKIVLVLPLLINVETITFLVYSTLDEYFGYRQLTLLDRTPLMLTYTVCLFVISDLSRYWLHRLMHAVPWLWEFHKVHHSAEVLTPFTFYRVHPIENLLFGLRYALSAGLVTGVFIYLFGAGLELFEVLGINVLVLSAHLVGDNLRHSPITLRYHWLEYLMISPAQHQYHHTRKGNRFNYGGVLAIWDGLFGSLRVSRIDDLYPFGIDDQKAYTSVFSLLFTPFANLVRQSSNTMSQVMKALKTGSVKRVNKHSIQEVCNEPK